MTFTAWNNGDKGFGFKISAEERDKYFSKDIHTVIIQLPQKGSLLNVECNTNKASFWNETCKELISSKIGNWLKENKFYPWTDGIPPKFEAEKINENTYIVLSRVK